MSKEDAIQLQQELSKTITVGKDVVQKLEAIEEASEKLEAFDKGFVEDAQEALRFLNRSQTGENGHFDLTAEQREALVSNIMGLETDANGDSTSIDHSLMGEFNQIIGAINTIEKQSASLEEDVDELNKLQKALKSTLYSFKP